MGQGGHGRWTIVDRRRAVLTQLDKQLFQPDVVVEQEPQGAGPPGSHLVQQPAGTVEMLVEDVAGRHRVGLVAHVGWSVGRGDGVEQGSQHGRRGPVGLIAAALEE